MLDTLVEKENPYALEYLGKIYESKNDPKAYEYLSKAAGLGLLFSQTFLAEQHFEGVESNLNDEDAFEILKKYIEKCNTRFLFTVGMCYYEGKGSNKDWKILPDYINLPREQVFPDGTFVEHKNHLSIAYERLGEMLSQGAERLTVDLLRATQFYQMASSLGNEHAKNWLKNDANAKKGKALVKEHEKEVKRIEKEIKKDESNGCLGCLFWIIVIIVAIKFLLL